MTPAAVITAVRECGGRFAIADDGRLVLRGAKRVPAALIAAIRSHKVAIKADVEARLRSAKGAARPRDFWRVQDARFGALLLEFGVANPRPKAKRRPAA
jgi:hypothetical protein